MDIDMQETVESRLPEMDMDMDMDMQETYVLIGGDIGATIA